MGKRFGIVMLVLIAVMAGGFIGRGMSRDAGPAERPLDTPQAAPPQEQGDSPVVAGDNRLKEVSVQLVESQKNLETAQSELKDLRTRVATREQSDRNSKAILTKLRLDIAEKRTANDKLEAELLSELILNKTRYDELMETSRIADTLKSVVNHALPLSETIYLNVSVVDEPGNLRLDKEEYEAIIRTELRKNGYTVTATRPAEGPYYQIYFNVSELISQLEVQSVYSVNLTIGVVDKIIARERNIYSNSKSGFAGVKADYQTSIRNTVISWLNKSIEQMAQDKDAVSATLKQMNSYLEVQLSPKRLAAVAAWQNSNSEKDVLRNTPAVPPKKAVVTGTGFIVSEVPLIVTNYHVISTATKVSVYRNGIFAEIPAKVVAVDTTNDIAILTTVDPQAMTDVVPLVLGTTTGMTVGEEVTTYGYPLSDILSDEVKLSKGIINSFFGPDNNPALLQISVPIQPGNSGGPLLDASGVVRGVVVSQLNPRWTLAQTGALPQNVNFAVKAEYVRGLLATNQLGDLVVQAATREKVKAEQAVVGIRSEQ